MSEEKNDDAPFTPNCETQGCRARWDATQPHTCDAHECSVCGTSWVAPVDTCPTCQDRADDRSPFRPVDPPPPPYQPFA